MSSNTQQQMSAGQAQTEDLIQSTKDSANAATDKTADATQSAKESAQDSKDQSASFLQQTGEQIVNMAQGAVDTITIITVVKRGNRSWRIFISVIGSEIINIDFKLVV